MKSVFQNVPKTTNAQASTNVEEVFALQLKSVEAMIIVLMQKLVKLMPFHLAKENVWMFVKDQSSVDEMLCVSQVNIDHFVHVLTDILETLLMRRLDARKSCVQTTKIVQEIVYVKSIDVLLH